MKSTYIYLYYIRFLLGLVLFFFIFDRIIFPAEAFSSFLILKSINASEEDWFFFS